MFTYKLIGDKEIAIKFKSAGKTIDKQLNAELKQIVKHLKEQIQNKFGSYQKGWPKLKYSTVIAKQKRRAGLSGMKSGKMGNIARGFNSAAGADDPLLLFSDLKNSINTSVSKTTGKVFSDYKSAAVHEYGYAPKGVPSRSYMRLTLAEEEDEIIRMIRKRIDKIL